VLIAYNITLAMIIQAIELYNLHFLPNQKSVQTSCSENKNWIKILTRI